MRSVHWLWRIPPFLCLMVIRLRPGSLIND
ncbi:MAG: hypothetical protein AW12_02039 [Candidatus Accumulibacter sp. BA-94]|nr:MAG: hypothetical protein AW12_02039 [Candidatus Accumulibacter sp. BA-94]